MSFFIAVAAKQILKCSECLPSL